MKTYEGPISEFDYEVLSTYLKNEPYRNIIRKINKTDPNLGGRKFLSSRFETDEDNIISIQLLDPKTNVIVFVTKEEVGKICDMTLTN